MLQIVFSNRDMEDLLSFQCFLFVQVRCKNWHNFLRKKTFSSTGTAKSMMLSSKSTEIYQKNIYIIFHNLFTQKPIFHQNGKLKFMITATAQENIEVLHILFWVSIRPVWVIIILFLKKKVYIIKKQSNVDIRDL